MLPPCVELQLRDDPIEHAMERRAQRTEQRPQAIPVAIRRLHQAETSRLRDRSHHATDGASPAALLLARGAGLRAARRSARRAMFSLTSLAFSRSSPSHLAASAAYDRYPLRSGPRIRARTCRADLS